MDGLGCPQAYLARPTSLIIEPILQSTHTHLINYWMTSSLALNPTSVHVALFMAEAQFLTSFPVLLTYMTSSTQVQWRSFYDLMAAWSKFSLSFLVYIMNRAKHSANHSEQDVPDILGDD